MKLSKCFRCSKTKENNNLSEKNLTNILRVAKQLKQMQAEANRTYKKIQKELEKPCIRANTKTLKSIQSRMKPLTTSSSKRSKR
jgi:hypothetical protein